MSQDLIKAFTNDKFGNVRVVLIGVDKEPYFVGKDVAECLGYSDTKDAIRKHVDEEDKIILQKGQITTLEIPNRGLTAINESGLYSLILGSKLSSAKEFKRWVTSEVLPAIRQTGTYSSIPMTMEDIIIYQMEQAKAMKTQLDVHSNMLAELKEENKGIRDIIALNPNSWRDESINLISQIAMMKGGTGSCYREIYNEIYDLVDARAESNLQVRLTNKRRRMADEGVCKSRRDKIKKLDVIAEDKRLIEIYLIVVKEMCIKYGVGLIV